MEHRFSGDYEQSIREAVASVMAIIGLAADEAAAIELILRHCLWRRSSPSSLQDPAEALLQIAKDRCTRSIKRGFGRASSVEGCVPSDGSLRHMDRASEP